MDASPAFICIAMGSAIGLTLRWLAMEVIGKEYTGFPYKRLIINVLGSCVLGAVVSAFSQFVPASHEDPVYLFFAVGLMGGFTLFSVFLLDLGALMEHEDIVIAVIYVMASIMLSIVALVLGWMAVAALS